MPVIADWHARMCLLQVNIYLHTNSLNFYMHNHQVVWSRFFTEKSYDRGTLNQLKHLVHRTAVGADPKHNMKPTEDFLHVVLCAHIVAATRH